MPYSFTPEEKQAVINRIIKHIEEEKNGSARVGWAIIDVLGTKMPYLVYPSKPYLLETIANTIIENPKYIKEESKQTKGDINIRKNPLYNEPTWRERNPTLYDILIIIITALLSVVSSVIVTNITTQNALDNASQSNSPTIVQENEQQGKPKALPKVSAMSEHPDSNNSKGVEIDSSLTK